MRVLVVGAGGLLGGNVVTSALDRDWEVVGTYHTSEPGLECPCYQLDVTETAAIETVISRVDPDAVINCAAMTDVDGCEDDPERAQAVNAAGAGHLAETSDVHDAAFVHTSTDYVFDGRDGTAYTEASDPQPIQVYGQSKLDGERRVRSAHADPTIARLSFVYGRSQPDGTLSGFPAWVRETAAGGDSVPLFTDQYVTPSCGAHTAETLLDCLDTTTTGTVNVAARSCLTPFEFGREILAAAALPTDRITESSMADVDRPAPRPAHTCLETAKIEAALGRPQPTVAESLESLL